MLCLCISAHINPFFLLSANRHRTKNHRASHQSSGRACFASVQVPQSTQSFVPFWPRDRSRPRHQWKPCRKWWRSRNPRTWNSCPAEASTASPDTFARTWWRTRMSLTLEWKSVTTVLIPKKKCLLDLKSFCFVPWRGKGYGMRLRSLRDATDILPVKFFSARLKPLGKRSRVTLLWNTLFHALDNIRKWDQILIKIYTYWLKIQEQMPQRQRTSGNTRDSEWDRNVETREMLPGQHRSLWWELQPSTPDTKWTKLEKETAGS